MNDRYRFVIEYLVLALQACIGLNFLAVAPVLSLIMDDYHIERATASLLVGGVSLMLALFMVPASMMAAKLGLKRSYALGALLMSAGTLTVFASSFPMLLVLRVLYGAGVAFVLPLTGPIVMGWFSSRSLPVVNSVNVVGQSLGITFAMFAAPSLGIILGWRVTLSIFGAVTLIAALGWALLGRESSASGNTGDPLSLTGMAQVLGQKTTLLLGLAFVGAFGQYVALSTWLPTYYNQVLGFSLGTAGLLAALLPLSGIFGSLAGGYLSARLGLRRPFMILPGLLLLFTGLGSFLSPNQPLLVLSLCLMGILSWVYLPAAFTIPMELPEMTPERVGVVLALALSLGNIAGFFSPLIVGFLTDSTGSFVPGLSMAAALGLTLSLSGAMLPETGPRARGVQVPRA